MGDVEVLLRGGLVRDILARIDRDSTDAGRAAASMVSDEVRKQVSSLTRTDWVDPEFMMAIDRALYEALGEEGFVHYWRDFATTAQDIPVLRPIILTSMRLFVRPWLICKTMPKVYRTMMRGLEIIDSERTGESSARFELRGTNALSEPRLFALANLGGLRGGLRSAGGGANAELEFSEDGAGSCVYLIDW